MQNIDDSQLKDRIVKVVQEYLKTSAFSDRKLTDTPTDALSTVNRKFVTLNGTSANRPKGSVLGQYYFDTSLGQPIWWNGNEFVDSTGTHA